MRLWLLFAATAAMAVAAATADAAAAPALPRHILFFLIDDYGFADASYKNSMYQGAAAPPTPTLDALVRGYSSLRFALFAAVAYSAAALAVALSKRGASPTTDDDTPGGPKGGADAGGAPASGGVGAVALSAYAAAHCGAMSQLMLKLVSCSLSAMPAALRYLLFGLGGLAVSAPLHLKLLR